VGEELVVAGHEVVVVTANLASGEGFYLRGVPKAGVQHETVGGVRVVRLPVDRRVPPRVGRSYPVFRKGLVAVINHFRPDVVMTLPHLFANVRVVLELEARLRFPLVLAPLLHEDDPAWPFDEVARAVRNAGAVVALTVHEGRRLVEAYKVDPRRVVVTGVGVDLPEQVGGYPRRSDVLFLGRQTRGKGLPLLLEAMSVVWNAMPDVRLLMVGPEVPGLNDMGQLVSAVPFEYRSRVESLGEVSDSVKSILLMESACVVVPSAREAFGLVILEAWAHGTPVVAVDSPVLSETVNSGSDGIIAPNNTSGLGEAMLAILGDPAKAEAMGKAGRTRVEGGFRWSEVAERFLSAYTVAIAGES
jgi:glycosyltransferase involved in cell wall biosynthesis